MTAIEKKVEQRVKDELTAIDMEERFREMLDECYSFDAVGGPFASMTPSRVLEEVDPVAFRCGVSDMPTDDMIEVDGEWYDSREVERVREEVEAEEEEDDDDSDDTEEDDDSSEED